MFYLLKLLFIPLWIIFLTSCTDQDKMKVTGAKVTTAETLDKDSLEEADKTEGELIVTDNDDETEGSQPSILTRELLEVGDRVYFDYDKTKFKQEGVETLKRQARFLQANPDITITVEGHCDQRGTREYNLALGQRRAFSVKNFLISLGVESDRITVISYGKEKLQRNDENEEAWALNRTVITILNP